MSKKCLTVYPNRCTGGMHPFSFPTKSNVNASSPPSVSGQTHFHFIFQFFSKANLYIATTLHCLTVNLSNTSGAANQLPGIMISLNLSASFFSTLCRNSRNIKLYIILNVMLEISTANCYSFFFLLPDLTIISRCVVACMLF